ncbi:hypothetical protein AB1Y20_006204 [Prymnesium parvum]|uniref:Uncharacterized protein n=1 Tax=Prymnesium parvum TaxID=97485 RepID=A0AB34J405_PRYPA
MWLCYRSRLRFPDRKKLRKMAQTRCASALIRIGQRQAAVIHGNFRGLDRFEFLMTPPAQRRNLTHVANSTRCIPST